MALPLNAPRPTPPTTLFEAIFDSLRRKSIRLVPYSKFEKKNWQDNFHMLGLDKPRTAKYFIQPDTMAKITEISRKLSEEDWTKVIRQVRLPFESVWIEFPPHPTPNGSRFETQRYGFYITPTRASDGGFAAYFFLSATPQGKAEIIGVGGAVFIFYPEDLANVQLGSDFLAGTDSSRTSKFAFDNNFVSTPESALEEFQRAAGEEELDFSEEMKKGSLFGIGAGSIILGSMRKETFLFLWLLTARIIKQGPLVNKFIRQRTKTRGTISVQVSFTPTEIDLLRVKEINQRPPGPPTGIERVRHGVQGHYVTRKGKRHWRREHERGSKGEAKPRAYTVKQKAPKT